MGRMQLESASYRYLPVLFGTGHKKSRVGGMPWPQTCATHYHAHLGSPDKDRAIKRLIVCNVLYQGYEAKDPESDLELTS